MPECKPSHEESSPPERCLSEGDLVDSSAPQRSERLGGRVWRAVPGSMDNLPKSLMGELSRKITPRAHSGSEDEGLPHSPPAEHPLTAPPPASLSHSSKSLTSCGDSSDGERTEELDFNALRRAESLDNTAAKHRIQVGRQRRKAAGPGALRKHKSCTTVQLAGITEEGPGKEELQVPLLRRQVSHDSAALLSQELEEMRGKEEEEEKKIEVKRTEKKEAEKGRAAPSTTVPVLRPVRKTQSSPLDNPPPSARHSAAPGFPSTTAASSRVPSTTAASTRVPSTTAASSKVPSTTAASTRVPSTTAASSKVPSTTAASSKVPSTTAASSKVPSTTAASSKVPSTTAASSKVPSSAAEASGGSPSAAAASRIGRLRSMFNNEPSCEPAVRPSSSASHRPASRIQSHAGDSAAPAASAGLVKAASLSGPAPKSFTVPAAPRTEPKPKLPPSPASPPPSLLFAASGGAKTLSGAPTSPVGSKTLPPAATKPPAAKTASAAQATRGASNFSAAKLSLKAEDKPKAAAATKPPGSAAQPAAATRKAPDSSTEGSNVQLREKKSPETAEEVASRPVSRVMDLVRNFQRLQESSTS